MKTHTQITKIIIGKILRFTFATIILLIPNLKQAQGQYSYYGHSVPVKTVSGHPLKMMLVFAELVGGCPDNSNTDWPAGSNPIVAGSFFDPVIPPSGPSGIITKYFYQASHGQYVVLGNFVDDVVQISCSIVDPIVARAAVITQLQNRFASGTLTFNNGYSLSDFDSYSTLPGTHFLPKAALPDNFIDIVVICYRNFSAQPCGTGNGCGSSTLFAQNVFGNLGIATGCGFGVCGSLDSYKFIVQELMHDMFGGNEWHGGNGQGFHTFPFLSNPWGITTQSVGAGCSNVVSGWDREFCDWYGWQDVNQTIRKGELISAIDEISGNEVVTNFQDIHSPLTPPGTFILRDFVTYGDAIKIKLPHINCLALGDVKNQYLWLENHQLLTDFDHSFSEDLPCKEPWTPGIYSCLQVGKDILHNMSPFFIEAPGNRYQPNSLGSWIFPLTAEGNYDFAYGTPFSGLTTGVNTCIWNPAGTPLNKHSSNTLPNPFTGYSDIFSYVNSNGDNELNRIYDLAQSDLSEINQSGNLIHNGHKTGDGQDAFSFNNNSTKLSIATNPAPVPVYTLTSDDNVHVGDDDILSYENRTIWLNGISAEILEENVSPALYGPGAVKVRIRFDDYDVDRDTRWCGNIKLSQHDFNSSIPSLNLLSNKTISIDRSRSATHSHSLGIDANGSHIFTLPTVMTCLANSYIEMGVASKIIVDNNSILDLTGTSKIILRSNAQLIVRNGSRLIIEPNALLQVESGGRVIIESGGTLEYQHDANIRLNGPNAVLEIQGILDIKDNANFTFGHSTTTNGYVVFNNTTLFPSRNIRVGTNCSMNFNGYASSLKVLDVEQEGLYAPDNLTNFSINKGTVILGSGSRVLPPAGASSIVYINQAKFTSNTPGLNNGHRGVQLFGQPNVTISNCTFEYGQFGIWDINTIGGSSLTVNNSTFRKCTWGIFSQDKGITLNSCNFFNCETGWQGTLMNLPCRTELGNVGGTYSSANVTGYKFESGSTGTLWIENPSIMSNYTGVDLPSQSFVTAHCGTVSNNNYGFSVGHGASLQMDASVSPDGGQVTAHNIITISANGANNLYLNQGFNDLSTFNPGTNASILGSFMHNLPIDANQNKWNDAGTFGSMDYDAWWIGTGNPPISISDQQPQASIVACGQANPPCSAPCDGLKSPLGYCPLCDIINTDDFYYEKLNDASNEAINKAKSTDPNNYKDAVDLFYQILMKQYTNPDEKEKYIIRLSYYKMADALGNAFNVGQITAAENYPTCQAQVLQMLEVQAKFINQAISNGDYHDRFFYSYDKALTYRLADRRDLALPLLDEIAGWVEKPQEINIISKAQCAISIEQQVLYNEIEKESMQENLESCQGVSFRIGNQINEDAPNNLSKNNEEDEKYTIYPNPVQNELTINSNIENGNVSLVNIVGQRFLQVKLNYDAFIDLSLYPRGIYVLEIENNETHKKHHDTIVLQ